MALAAGRAGQHRWRAERLAGLSGDGSCRQPLLTPCPAATRLPALAGAGGGLCFRSWGYPMGIALIWGLALILTRWITSKVGHFAVPVRLAGFVSRLREDKSFRTWAVPVFLSFKSSLFWKHIICHLRLCFLRVCTWFCSSWLHPALKRRKSVCVSCTSEGTGKRPPNGRALLASFGNRPSILKSLKGFEKIREKQF